MWGNPRLFHRTKSIEKVLRKDKYWHSQLRKAYSTKKNRLKKYWEKINIGTFIWENLFDRSAEHK